VHTYLKIIGDDDSIVVMVLLGTRRLIHVADCHETKLGCFALILQ